MPQQTTTLCACVDPGHVLGEKKEERENKEWEEQKKKRKGKTKRKEEKRERKEGSRNYLLTLRESRKTNISSLANSISRREEKRKRRKLHAPKKGREGEGIFTTLVVGTWRHGGREKSETVAVREVSKQIERTIKWKSLSEQKEREKKSNSLRLLQRVRRF